jgi:hypothetical protein
VKKQKTPVPAASGLSQLEIQFELQRTLCGCVPGKPISKMGMGELHCWVYYGPVNLPVKSN